MSEGKIVSNQIISILVIDDDEEIRTSLSIILKDEGYLVETVKKGKEALKIVKKTEFNVALIDIELPDTKGTELISKLKKIQPKIVTILVTGHPSISNAIKAVNQKADGYILKPYSVPKLLETIKTLLAEKTNAYFQMFTEVERVKGESTVFKYEPPEWY